MKTFNDLSTAYMESYDFNACKPDTQRDYIYWASRLGSVPIGGKLFGFMNPNKINTPIAQKAYEYLLNSGVSMANHIVGVGSIVFGHSIRLGSVNHNPFTYIKRRSLPPRKVVWTDEDISTFLTTAYSQFRWRNVGLIVQMSYEWCQRQGDMRLLKWEQYDLETGILVLEQSKRGAEVTLPTSAGLQAMLKKQHQDFGFQKWIAPRPRPVESLYQPYSMRGLSVQAKIVRDASGISDKLQIRDMRRTGTTELVEAGVDLPQIMSVTGHANPASVKPYMKNTLKSSSMALQARWDSKT
jgi:integrase